MLLILLEIYFFSSSCIDYCQIKRMLLVFLLKKSLQLCGIDEQVSKNIHKVIYYMGHEESRLGCETMSEVQT